MSPSNKGTEPDRDITAQPRPVSDQITTPTAPEPGLSVDPEDLGTHFLNEATEQNNFESSVGSSEYDRSVIEGPPSDEALTGPSFEPERDIWEQTIDLALQSGGVDQTRAQPALEGDVDDEPPVRVDQDVMMQEPSIREASLFDENGEEAAEIGRPRADTEDDEAPDWATATRPTRARSGRVHPVVAGMLSTAAMSMAMRVAQVTGLLRRPPPALIAQRALRLRPIAVQPSKPLLNTLAHFGYGTALALPFSALQRRLGRDTGLPIAGILYGLAVYVANYEVVLPALRLMPPAHEDRPSRVAAMTVAHMIYGSALESLLRR